MKIIIVGKSGSGKDYFKKYLENRGLTADVSYTTRKIKEHEKDGEHYYFVSNDSFNSIVEKGLMIQWQEFKGNKYGTHITNWDSCDVFIMNVNGLNQLTPEIRKQALVYYLNIDDLTRYIRILERDYNMNIATYNFKLTAGDNDTLSIEKAMHDRIKADDAEYSTFDDFDIEIKNPDFLNIKREFEIKS